MCMYGQVHHQSYINTGSLNKKWPHFKIWHFIKTLAYKNILLRGKKFSTLTVVFSEGNVYWWQTFKKYSIYTCSSLSMSAMTLSHINFKLQIFNTTSKWSWIRIYRESLNWIPSNSEAQTPGFLNIYAEMWLS